MKTAKYLILLSVINLCLVFAVCVIQENQKIIFDELATVRVELLNVSGAVEQHTPLTEKTAPTLESLIDAIEKVESNNNDNAIGDSGNAVGRYQLWKIYVDDVNRILDERKYDYEARLNPQKSREMVKAYLAYYATTERLGHTPTLEDMARIHNGGPNGYKKECTKQYWEKVKRVLGD